MVTVRIYYCVGGQQPKQLFVLAMKQRATEKRKTFRVAVSLYRRKEDRMSTRVSVTPRNKSNVVGTCKRLFL